MNAHVCGSLVTLIISVIHKLSSMQEHEMPEAGANVNKRAQFTE